MHEKISILLPDLAGGGAERLHVNLANDWINRGIAVDVALMRRAGELLAVLDPRVLVHDLQVPRIRSLLAPLTRYLKSARPTVTIAAMWPVTSMAVAAWTLAGRPGRLFLSDHSQLSVAAIHEIRVPEWLLSSTMRLTYPRASGVVAVSAGVKKDMCTLGRLEDSLIRVIYNPAATGVPYRRGSERDRAALWGSSSGHHILSVGTLKTQKDHATLLKAIHIVRREIDVRLTILGEGTLRGELERLTQELGLADIVHLAGFVLDPYPWYQTADLFVLSSRWEGFGNVLVEALECGLPVVSTDCASGPSEILDDGRYGRLVPVQDPEAMAAAIVASLKEPHDPQRLRRRAQDFSVRSISDQYLQYFECGAQA
jgi:glycosyltransferase involved in cell wall biosynthesis